MFKWLKRLWVKDKCLCVKDKALEWMPFYEREMPHYTVRQHGSLGDWLVEINYLSYQFAFERTAPTAADAVKQAVGELKECFDRLREKDNVR